MTEVELVGRHYAIRQKSTNLFLPQSDRTVRAGFTHMEPRDPRAQAPRLFTREQDAKCALSWWLKGEVNVGTSTEDDWLGNPYTIRTGPGRIHPVAGRSADDMEVVMLTLFREREQ